MPRSRESLKLACGGEQVSAISILSEEYALPALPAPLRELPLAIARRAAVVESGEEPRPRLLGLIPRDPRKLTVEERFEQLDLLVQDYDAVIGHLQTHRVAFQAFFRQLGEGVEAAVEQKAEQVQELERKRVALAGVAEKTGDRQLLARVEVLDARLMQGVRRLGQATLLILKKIDLCREGVERLAEDQDRQRAVLGQLVGRLGAQREMHRLEQKVSEFEREVEQMAQQALGFEGYMRDYFGPLQGVLEQVSLVDQGLHTAVNEIEDLSRHLTLEGGGSLPALGREEQVLDFLVSAQLKRERLPLLLDAMQNEVGALERKDVQAAVSGTASLEDAVCNIRGLLQLRLEGAFGGAALLRAARATDTAAAWQAYLDEFPRGHAAAEASESIARLAARARDEARARAEAAGTSAAWQTFLEAHPDGPAAEEARAAIARLEAEALAAALDHARGEDTCAAWEALLARYPTGAPATEAWQALVRHESRARAEARAEALERARAEDSPATWRAFLDQHAPEERAHTLHAYAVDAAGAEVLLAGCPSPAFHLPGPFDVIQAAGCLEEIGAEGVARGWAVDVIQPERPVSVHFYEVGGGVIGSVTADEPRADVNALGYAGDHGFTFRLPDALRDGRARGVIAWPYRESRGYSNGQLWRSPLQVQLTRVEGDAAPTAAGARVGLLDAVSVDGAVLGWAVDPDEPTRPVDVELHLDGPAGTGVPLGYARADRSCPELDPSGLAGASQRGFLFRLSGHARDGQDHVLHAYVRDRDGVARALTRSPLVFRLASEGQPAPHVEGRLQTGRDEQGGFARGVARQVDGVGDQVRVRLYLGGPRGTGALVVDSVTLGADGGFRGVLPAELRDRSADEGWRALARLEMEAFERLARSDASAEEWRELLRVYPRHRGRIYVEQRLARAVARAENTPRAWRALLALRPGDEEALAFVGALPDWVPEWASAWGEDERPNSARWVELKDEGRVQRLRLLRPGTFVMGSPAGEVRHEVTLTRPLWLAERAVEEMTSQDCLNSLARLNARVAGLEATLPSEAQREYAARAGLCDLHGDEGEWCLDSALGEHPPGRVTDPLGHDAGLVCRGGRRSARQRLAVPAAPLGETDVERLSRIPELGVFLGDIRVPLLTETADEGGDRLRVNEGWTGDAGVAAPPTVAGRRCERYVGLLGPARVDWLVPAGARQFTAVVTTPDDPGLLFDDFRVQLWLDHRLVLETPPASERRGGLPIDLGLPAGSNVLSVRIDALGPKKRDAAVLCWPCFHPGYSVEPGRVATRPDPVRVVDLARVPAGSVFLGDLTPTAARVASHEFEANPPDFAVSAAGRVCDQFLFAHAPSEVTYRIPARAVRFTAVGTRRGHPGTRHGTWKYRVVVDGRLVLESPPLHDLPDGIPIEVPLLATAQELTLLVDALGDHGWDHSVWAWPCFHLASPTEGLVGHWKLDALGVGHTPDHSGRGHAGRLVGFPALGRWVADRPPGPPQGCSLRFDGARSQVVVPATDALSPQARAGGRLGCMTLCGWVKVRAFSASQSSYLASKTGDEEYSRFSREYGLDFDARGARFWIRIAGGQEVPFGRGLAEVVVGGGSLPLERWTHLCGVLRPGALELFVDGALVGSVALTGEPTAPTSAPLRLGAWRESGVLDGLLADVRLYDRALDADEVERLADRRERDPLTPLLAAPRHGVFLGDLVPLRAEVGADEPAETAALVAGARVDTSLWVHPPAKLVYALPAGVERFTAIGARADDDVGQHGSWRYRVLVDSRLVLETPLLAHRPAGLPFEVALPRGARELTLEVDDLGDPDADHAVLACPYLHLSGPPSRWGGVALRRLEVEARAGWVDTGLSLEKGQRVHVEQVGGRWTSAAAGAWTGGAGIPEHELAPELAKWKVLRAAPLQALLGAVADEAAPFHVGPRRLIQARVAGRLLLRTNDADPSLHDNQGALVVELRLLPPDFYDLATLLHTVPPRVTVGGGHALPCEVRERGDLVHVTGRHGRSLSLDGAKEHVSLGDLLNLGGDDFTLALWVLGDPGMGPAGMLVDKHIEDGGYSLRRLDSREGGQGVQFGLPCPSHRSWVAARSPLLDHRWHHIAVVRRSSTLTIYADGGREQESTLPPGSEARNDRPLLLGNCSELRHGWKGELQDVRLYRRAISESELGALAASRPV